jgi:4-amino-4-deoxy-L-arabinose transferase-like glycosyltransferase/membrane-associated phospholipid phosphatase
MFIIFASRARNVYSRGAVLQDIDTALFRLINQSSGNPFLDWFIDIFNGGPNFKRVAVAVGLLLLLFGNSRARICLLFLALALAIGDVAIIGTIKKTVARERPYLQFKDTKMITGRGDAFSMPSGHAANSTCAAVVIAIFYRRGKWFMFPMAGLVCLARVYSGVHFPSDVIVGASLALIYTPAILYGVEKFWTTKAPALVPNWTERIPSLLHPPDKLPARSAATAPAQIDWLKLGWYLIGATLVLRLLYLASGKIELSEDEAYQWLWSKHLALSYYSKPPLIAYTQWLGTHIFGDTQFGVRFLSPLFAAITGSALLVFLAREFNPRTAFFTVAALCAAPLPAVGATLMTIDALSVLFWTLAMVTCWRAIQRDSLRDWIVTGIFIAFGLLAKYIALAQWIPIVLFLTLAARAQFRKPGVYLAFIISLLGLLPVIIWNQQNNWITLTHLGERSGLDQAWRFSSRYLNDFFWQELLLLNPVFFILIAWAALRFWKNRTPLQTYLFCMGAPLFLGYFLYTIRARVQPNWIAPAILPLFALAATYWDARWTIAIKRTVTAGFVVGFIAVILTHDTNLTGTIAAVRLPAKYDPLKRVRAWSTLANEVAKEREKLEAAAGKPFFVVADHYGLTSLLTFYTPSAKKNIDAQIFVVTTDVPHNQFYFWPNYLSRAGENALFVQRADSQTDFPPELTKQFESIEDLGFREILYRGQVFHHVSLYACRNLRPQAAGATRR